MPTKRDPAIAAIAHAVATWTDQSMIQAALLLVTAVVDATGSEEWEDLQETIALGLSDEFQAELDAAAREAGIEPDPRRHCAAMLTAEADLIRPSGHPQWSGGERDRLRALAERMRRGDG